MSYVDTTDVQLVAAIFDESSDGFLVRCDFILGTEDQGCMVILVGQVDNITVNLIRNNRYTTGIINLILPASCYYEILGYDIESDGSIGALAVPGRINLNATSDSCSLNTITVRQPPRM